MVAKAKRSVKALIVEDRGQERPDADVTKMARNGNSSRSIPSGPETPGLPIVTVQQFTDGSVVREERRVVHYNVLEAMGTGIRLRYTGTGAEAAKKAFYEISTTSIKDAHQYRENWVFNRLRAREYQATDETLVKAFRSLTRTFWGFEVSKVPDGFIAVSTEDIEYIYFRTFKMFLRLSVPSWERKAQKWQRALFPLKPHNPTRRKEKSAEARACIESWIREHVKTVKGEYLDKPEHAAYCKLIADYVLKPIDDEIKKLDSNQIKFDIEEVDK